MARTVRKQCCCKWSINRKFCYTRTIVVGTTICSDIHSVGRNRSLRKEDEAPLKSGMTTESQVRVLLVILVVLLSTSVQAITIDTVPIGNAGNPADTRYIE